MKPSKNLPVISLLKRKFSAAALTAAFLIFLVSVQTGHASENLLLQGGREDFVEGEPSPTAPTLNLPDGMPIGGLLHFYPNKLVGGVVEDADAYTLARDTEIKHSGESSLRIEGNKNTCDLGVHFGPTTIEPGNRYKITVWLRGENITLAPSLNSKFAGVVVLWQAGTKTSYWGNDDQMHGRVDLPENLREGTFDWTPVEFEVDAKDDTTALGFRVILQAATGKLWVDDATIESISN